MSATLWDWSCCKLPRGAAQFVDMFLSMPQDVEKIVRLCLSMPFLSLSNFQNVFDRLFCQNLPAASQEKSQAAHSEPKDVNMPAVAVPDGGQVS